jgi:hypothetical protein
MQYVRRIIGQNLMQLSQLKCLVTMVLQVSILRTSSEDQFENVLEVRTKIYRILHWIMPHTIRFAKSLELNSNVILELTQIYVMAVYSELHEILAVANSLNVILYERKTTGAMPLVS